jgi:hypothetical protein
MFIPIGDWQDDDQPDHTAVREVWMKIVNRSGVPQVAVFTKFQVLWPRRHRGFTKWFAGEEIPVPPYGGGAFKFYANNHAWINASELEKQRLAEEPRYRCLTYVTLQTTSGHRARYLGFLEFGMTIYHPRRGPDGQLLDGSSLD